MSPQIVRNHNDPNHAVTLNGRPVQREKTIYLPSHQANIETLPTSMHFCFRDPDNLSGSTLFCTCGSFAAVFGYEGYKRWSSWISNEVIACHHFIQFGVHSDGSHE